MSEVLDAAVTHDPALHAQFDELTNQELQLLEWALTWRDSARAKQLPPDDVVMPDGTIRPWSTWGIMTGRGFGKTLTGGHWMMEAAGNDPGSYNGLIAPTLDDVRYTLIEGPTGLLGPDVGFPEALIDDYNVTAHKITLWNGAVIRGFSSEKPNKLRGPQHHRVWGDEIAAWENAVDTYNMMKFGLRLGPNPQFLWTSTPKPNKIIKKLLADRKAFVVTGSSYENRANLAGAFWDEIAQYAGTKLGRQELDGEVLNEEEDGIIESKWIKRWPAGKPLPKFIMLVASLDTAFTEKDKDKKSHEPDQSVMQVWGVFVLGKEYHVMLVDAWRDYLNFPNLVARVQKELKRTYGDQDEPLFKPYIATPTDAKIQIPHTAGHQGRPIDIVIIEDKGSGISLRQQLAFENVLAFPYNPGRADKLLRLHLVSPVFAAGRVWMPASTKQELYLPGQLPPVRSWAEPVREALCTFRGEGSIEKDDDVDAATQCLKYIKDTFMRSLYTEKGGQVEEKTRERGSKGQERVNPYAA